LNEQGIELMKKIYVGNLPWSVDDDSLRELFADVGTVHSATVVKDRDTGRSRGFGFVEMDDGDADQAISRLNGHSVDSRELRVNEAQQKERSSSRW
jgi:RNA recognition motif-containing protein